MPKIDDTTGLTCFEDMAGWIGLERDRWSALDPPTLRLLFFFVLLSTVFFLFFLERIILLF